MSSSKVQPLYRLIYNGQVVHQSNSLDVVSKVNSKYCYGKGIIHSILIY